MFSVLSVQPAVVFPSREDGELEDGEIDDEGIGIEEEKKEPPEVVEVNEKEEKKVKEKEEKTHRHSRKRYKKSREKRRSKRRRRDRPKVCDGSIPTGPPGLYPSHHVLSPQHHSPSSSSSSDSYDSDYEWSERPKARQGPGRDADLQVTF